MSFRTGYQRKRCKLDGCGDWASRSCRVCERPVCRNHRFGSGHWFRCYECPSQALREARALWAEQEAEERAALRAEAQHAPATASERPFPHIGASGLPELPGGVLVLGRLELLREMADSLGLARARARGEGMRRLAPEALEALRSPGRGGRHRGRPVPWRELRRWRRQAAARRGQRGAPPPRPRQPRRRQGRAPLVRWVRLARSAVSLVLVLALALAPVGLVRQLVAVAPAAHPGQPVARTGPASPTLEPLTVDVYADTQPGRAGAPPAPVKGQKRAPCLEGLEVTLSGYCWLPVQARPPKCPPQTVAYGESCLLPMAPQRRPPSSVDAGLP